MGKHNEFGKQGEQLAADFLLEKGYEILARNYRYLNAEVDIIAKKGEILCIVEVKSRNTGFVEDISDSINKKKIKLLIMAADRFVNEHNLDIEVRFDVITVIRNQGKFAMEHLKNAFYHF